MPSKPLYHYLYASIPRAKEFNSFIANHVNEEDISIDLDRWKEAKNAIASDFINKQTIGIALNRAIIIGLVMSSLETIAKREEMELLGLLRRLETGIISRRFLVLIS